MLEAGMPAPNFTAPTDGNGSFTLGDQQGKFVVLYFYPKDSTPGCTVEACNFRDSHPDFSSLNAVVIGVSKDSVRRHDNFVKKQELNFPLVSDADSDICEQYGTWVKKKMYGKEYMGIARATFLIGPDGVIRHVWPKVKVKGHSDEVLEVLRAQSA
jgi:peroxiredoxin